MRSPESPERCVDEQTINVIHNRITLRRRLGPPCRFVIKTCEAGRFGSWLQVASGGALQECALGACEGFSRRIQHALELTGKLAHQLQCRAVQGFGWPR